MPLLVPAAHHGLSGSQFWVIEAVPAAEPTILIEPCQDLVNGVEVGRGSVEPDAGARSGPADQVGR